MRVRLLTTRWDQRTPRGIVRRHRGDLFSVKDDVAEWLIASGSAEQAGRSPAPAKPEAPADPPVEAADEDGGDVIEDLDGDDDPESEAEPVAAEPEATEVEAGLKRPAQSAPKADWVAYAVSRGVPAREAESLDKPKLISRAG